MATNTENYNLTKPSNEDFYDVQVQNDNMDIIDAKLKSLSDDIVTASADAKKAGTDAQSNLNTHTSNKSNPHGVTASQVGLGKVPNVATNDQTPTYSDASTLATLVSGEKLSVAFGKIKKAITDLIAHVSKSATSSTIGHVKITDSLTSTATDTAASAKAIKTVNDKVINQGFELIKSQTITTGTMQSTTSGKGVTLSYPVTGIDYTEYEELVFEYIGSASLVDASGYTFTGGRSLAIGLNVEHIASPADTYSTNTQIPCCKLTNSPSEVKSNSLEFDSIIRVKPHFRLHEKDIGKGNTRYVYKGLAVASSGAVFEEKTGTLQSLSIIAYTYTASKEDLKISASANFTVNIYGKKGF